MLKIILFGSSCLLYFWKFEKRLKNFRNNTKTQILLCYAKCINFSRIRLWFLYNFILWYFYCVSKKTLNILNFKLNLYILVPLYLFENWKTFKELKYRHWKLNHECILLHFIKNPIPLKVFHGNILE